MSLKSTTITEEIDNYIDHLFSSKDEILSKIIDDADSKGMPQISISPLQSSFLQFFLKSINAKYVIEIGSLAGYSTISMAQALPEDGKLVAVEINSEYSELIQKNSKMVNLNHIINVVNANAIDFLNSFKPDFQFDFAFVDADKENYINYFDKIDPLIKIGGVFCADNALASGYIAQENPTHRVEHTKSIQKFNKYLSEHPSYKSILVPLGDGFAMGVKIK